MNETDAPAVGAIDPKVKAIREYIQAGYVLIPVNGKTPTVSDWVNTPPGKYDEKVLLQNNYGVALKMGDLVIDVDPRNFARGDHPLSRLIKAAGSPLSSFTVRTGGGGLHVYLRKPADFQISQGLRDYPGIEFKSAGRQVVGPGSIHPETGKTYEIAQGSPLKVAEAPAGLLALLKKTATVASLNGTGEYKDDAETKSRYRRYLLDGAAASIEGQKGDENAFKVACHGRDLGLSPRACWDAMLEHWNPRCKPPWDADELKTKVLNTYKYARGAVGSAHPAADFTALPVPFKAETPRRRQLEGDISWVMARSGAPAKCFYNILNYLRLPKGGTHNVFGFNEFTNQIEFINPAPWHDGIMPRYVGVGDNDLIMLKAHLAVRHSYEMPTNLIYEALVTLARDNSFHPVREYLDSLKWDGKPRLDTWLHDYLGVKNDEYSRAVARKTLCAAVMRVMRPGCKFDHVLVLEGEQDIGKSSVCRILAGKWGGDFSIDPHNKDTVQLMQGLWIIELAELEVTRRTEADALKAFLTRNTDKARFAYGRTVGEFPRQSIFIASKNPGPESTYLKDDTGNRRWWPVLCKPRGGQVDFKALKEARNHLFAEAAHLIRTRGEHLFMNEKSLKSLAAEEAALRHVENPWVERIASWIDGKGEGFDFVTARDVFIDAMGGIDKQLDRRAAVSIASAMRTLQWEPTVRRIGKRVVRGYTPKKAGGADDAALGDLV